MIFSVHDECLYCVSTIFKFFHEKPVFFYPFMKSFCLWERELIVLFPLVEFSCICIFQSGMSSNWNWQYSCSVQRNAVNVRFGMVRIQDGRTCLLLSSSTAPRPANLLPRRLPSKIHDFIIAALKLQRLNRNVSLFDIEKLKPIASVFLCYYFQLQWQDINTWEIPVS